MQREFISELIKAEAPSIGRRGARLLSDRGLLGSWGAEGMLAWREALEARARELAAAIGADRDVDMATRALWARTAFEARGVPVEDLVQSLHALKQAVLEVVPAEDAAVVRRAIDGAIAAASGPSSEPPAELAAEAPHGRLAAGYLLALLEGDRLRATSLVYEAVRRGDLGVPDAYEFVFMPVLRELGRMWHLTEISVAEEHFATATTLIAMSQIAPMAVRKAANGRAVLAATVAGNAHEVGVRMVADRFEWEGWRVVYLGPNVPAEDLASAAVDFGVDAVALSASLTEHLESLGRAIAAVRAAARDVCVVVGGAALQGDGVLAARLGADALAADPEDAIRIATAHRRGGLAHPPGRAADA